MTDFITRFAPSPTGLLHLGHAFSALTAYEAARKKDGAFILRIEDIDAGRCKPEFEQAIYDDLEWLGLSWLTPVRRQSDHFKDYENALAVLRNKGLVYRCFKTRKEVAEAIASAPHLSPDGPEGPQYFGEPLTPNKEKEYLRKGQAFAWRLNIKKAIEATRNLNGPLFFTEEGAGPKGETGEVTATPEVFGDAIIARKDARTSYHIASVVDDALQGVTHIIRGEDLFHATHLHRLLQILLDLPAPIYHHHRLITDENGARLSKRDQSITLRALREDGATPQDIRKRLGF
ncbi:MAG: tRNA glutamyl-Q(34) synthetase GluQRS [Hyphococcus sp.]|nr:MAG: tRNA glutamyl-Q(34) synthetase GluQRS [Marinicaulis sp.]